MTVLTIIHLEKLRPWFIVAVFFSLLVACQKDTDAPTEYKYLVDYKLNKVYSADAIKTMLLIQSLLYPEINDIEEYIDYGVQVYQVNYKTLYRD